MKSGTDVTAWSCPNCRGLVETPFCPGCGEQRLRARHLTLRDLAHQAMVALSSVDGKLLRSLRAVVLRPGELTLAFIEGRRTPFLGPLQIFLLANGLFFALHPFARASVFSSPLKSHLHQQDWSGLAQRLVAARLEAKNLTLAAYTPVFDHAVVLNAKALVILMALAFAPLLALTAWNSRRPLAAHVVFALHLYAFLLILFCGALLIIAVDLRLGGAGLASHAMDVVLSVIELVVCAGYLYVALGVVYGAGRLLRVFQALVLTATVGAIVLGYRFAVFLITLYTT